MKSHECILCAIFQMHFAKYSAHPSHGVAAKMLCCYAGVRLLVIIKPVVFANCTGVDWTLTSRDAMLDVMAALTFLLCNFAYAFLVTLEVMPTVPVLIGPLLR